MIFKRLGLLQNSLRHKKNLLTFNSFKYFSSDSQQDWKTIYQQDQNQIATIGLVGGSFLSAVLTDNFVIPLCLGSFSFISCLTSSLIAHEIKYNQANKNVKIQQKRRLLIFRPNEVSISLNQINVMYLGSKFAFINVNNNDIMKAYMLPLSEEENTLLIQLLNKRKNN